MNTEIQNPPSVLSKSQKKIYGPKIFISGGLTYRITTTVRYDDRCDNGHNSFSITGSIYRKAGNGWRDDAGGCIHDEIQKHFPELAPFIKWHLFSSTGPMHYLENTIYQAGDRDCHGLRAGEFRQYHSHGVPNWVLELPDRTERDVYANEKPAPVVCEWKPYGRTGEGKKRELDFARSTAVWPEATDDELTAPGLEQRLLDRLPALILEFKAAVESLGFTY